MEAEAADRAFQLISGFRSTQMIAAVTELGVPDLVVAGARSAGELAAATGVLEDPLRRVLRALVSVGVFAETSDGRFAPTAVSDCLTDRPGTLRGWALLLPRESYRAFGELMHTLATGEPSYEKVFGAPWFEHLARDPDAAALFNLAMRGSTEDTSAAVVAAYDFAAIGSVVDVGGGRGTLLAAILRANAHLRGAVFDLPSGLEGAAAYLEQQGVAARCELVSGSFFDAVPAGYDLYLLKEIVHDWRDDQALAILGSCQAAMSDGTRLLMVERVLPTRADDSAEARRAFMVDVQMLVALGGRERTVDEYDELLRSSGLRLSGVSPTSSPFQLIEAIREPSEPD